MEVMQPTDGEVRGLEIDGRRELERDVVRGGRGLQGEDACEQCEREAVCLALPRRLCPATPRVVDKRHAPGLARGALRARRYREQILAVLPPPSPRIPPPTSPPGVQPARPALPRYGRVAAGCAGALHRAALPGMV